MKRKIIGLTLTAAMLAATAQTAFAGFYLPNSPFEQTTKIIDESDPKNLKYTQSNMWKWDDSDSYQYKDTGIVSESDLWMKNFGNYEGLFKGGWIPNSDKTQSIILGLGKDDVVSSLDDFKAAKYANISRNCADMCEWNGYLFVLMNAPMAEVKTPREEGKEEKDRKVVYTNKVAYLADDAVYAAQQEDGTWAQTDINGNYILDDSEEKIILEGYTFNTKITKNSSQIQVYDITNGRKEYVAEWDCQKDLGINCDTKLGADYLAVGLDVTDDYIYCYVAPRGVSGEYQYDANRYCALALFENSIDRNTASYEIPNRITLQGEANNIKRFNPVYFANQAYDYSAGFRHFMIDDKLLVFSNVNSDYIRTQHGNGNIFTADISNIGNGELNNIKSFEWASWLNFAVPENCKNSNESNNNSIKLIDFKVEDKFGYALIEYQMADGKYCYVFKKYDISNLAKPVELSEAKHISPSRESYCLLKVSGGYVYAMLVDYQKYLNASEGKEAEASNTVLLIYDAKNNLEKKQEIYPTRNRLFGTVVKTNGVATLAPMGNWLYASFVSGGNGMVTYECFFKFSDDKTELLDGYATTERVGLPNDLAVIYGQRLYVGNRRMAGYGTANAPYTISRIAVFDMKQANAVDLKLDKVPAQVEAPYTLTGKLAGANMEDVFQITVNNQEPIYVTYEDLDFGEGDYWAKFNYSVTEPGDYTITVAPMSIDSEPIMGAAETVSFTVLPKEVPNELKLTADYSSEIGQGTLSVTPKVTNNIGKGAVSGTPIAALYKDGVLVEAKSGAVQTVEDGAYQKALTSINLTVPADTDYSKYNVKVFLFESLNNIKPITNSVSYR